MPEKLEMLAISNAYCGHCQCSLLVCKLQVSDSVNDLGMRALRPAVSPASDRS